MADAIDITAAFERLNRALTDAEDFLDTLPYGHVTADVPVPGREGGRSSWILHWKRNDGGWGFFAVNDTTQQMVPIMSAPQFVRVAVPKLLPDLLDVMHARATLLCADVEAAAASVEDFLAARRPKS
jgi:hypothetical protein